MLTFKFEYPVKPTTEYKFGYGLKSKARPYPFNYPVGTNNGGMYRFNYDRREEVYIEDNEKAYVLWPRDMDIDRGKTFVLWPRNIDINRELTQEISDRYIEKSKDKQMQNICKDIEKYRDINFEKKLITVTFDEDRFLEKTAKELLVYTSAILTIITKKLAIEKSFINLRKKVGEFNKEKPLISSNRLKKRTNIEKPLKSLNKSIDELYIPINVNILSRAKKALEKEIGGSVFDGNIYNLQKDTFTENLEATVTEMLYEKIKEQLKLNLLKEIDIFQEIGFINNYIENIEIDKKGKTLNKEEKAEILIKSIILLSKIESGISTKTIAALSKLEDETDIYEGEKLYFKTFNEIFNHKELLKNTLYLSALYDMAKEKEFIQLELSEEEMAKFKDKILDKNFEVDLEAEDMFKTLINNTKHNLFEDIKEDLLKDETIHEADIEKCFKQIEEVYEIIIDIENRMKQLDKEYIVDLYEEKDIHQLTKKLVIHDLITEEEFVQLEKSPIGQILLEQIVALNKALEIREIEIDESIPMVKAYKEIMINEDINAAKKAIEIDINKEKEFWKVLNEIKIEDDEEKIKFNKRFWFLRATDPFDWKILPYSDYPYKEKPIIFGKELIPDNWQLDMPWVPKLHEGIYEHPIPFGEDLAREEMAISIEIMIDIINIMILIWSRMYYNFSGYTGSQAVIRFTKLLYDWLMLETSIDEMEKKGSKEHYFRCYRWIRWEAEKVAIKARDDMELNGNMYISEWIFELIYYMENHHFDTMPIFDVIEKMDEFRAMLPTDDPQGDINFVLNKIKGMRHRIIECKSKKSNE